MPLRWLVFAWLACAAVLARAETPPIRAGELAADGRLVMGRFVADLRDPEGKLRIEEAADPSRPYAALTAERPNFGYEQAHHWLRFTIDGRGITEPLVLVVGLSTIDLVEFYQPRPGGGYTVQRAGDRIPWSARPVPHRHHVFVIDDPGAMPRQFHLRVASTNTLTVPLTLWTRSAFERHERGAQLAFGLFYGLIAALFLYNLVLYVSLRDLAYLWYVAYTGTFGLALFTLDGYAFEHLWPHNVWWANHALGTFFCLAILFAGLFAREFLGSRARFPRADRVMVVTITSAGLLALCSATGRLLEYGEVMRLLSFIAPLGAALTLWLGVRAMIGGFAPARYFLLAWSALLGFVVLGALRNFALVPQTTLTEYGLHVGLAADVLLLSTALAARIRAMQTGLIAAQSRHLEATRQHQSALESRARELADANQELEAFSHTVAHDLRAPLRAIDNFAHLLEEEHRERLPESGRRDLDAISRNARRMATLVDGLLEYARLGRVAPAEEAVSMRGLVDAVIQEILSPQRAVIEIGALPTVLGDALLLKQVWANLIGNALKFSAGAPAPLVRVEAAVTGAEVVFSVADNGVGFDPTYASKLFGMFQRLHAAGEFEGTGVGLAIVKRIVERHGGRVWGASPEAAGACFRFALPIARLVTGAQAKA
ncbi:MAG: hypothetical protein JNM90_03770 [Burkholderiales bacterium]|nr:hypothetical protein [Burkholderiales bacterium]